VLVVAHRAHRERAWADDSARAVGQKWVQLNEHSSKWNNQTLRWHMEIAFIIAVASEQEKIISVSDIGWRLG